MASNKQTRKSLGAGKRRDDVGRGHGSPEVGDGGDDSIIGKMFWRSLAVAGGFAAVGGLVYAITRPVERKEIEKKTDTVLPQQRATQTAQLVIPEIPFQDITQDAGIDFTHYDGKRGERLLPETMGGGSGFFDYDNDGDQDILFVNACDGLQFPKQVY